MTTLLLLDIDGVMVPAQPWKQLEPMEDGFYCFSPQAVSALKQLLQHFPEMAVWLTTSHKSRFSIEQWKTIFANRGLHIKKLAVLDENTQHLNRKDEIRQWYKKHQKEVTQHILIIDDDKSLNELPARLKQRLLLTNASIGLTEAHLQEAKNILSRTLKTQFAQ